MESSCSSIVALRLGRQVNNSNAVSSLSLAGPIVDCYHACHIQTHVQCTNCDLCNFTVHLMAQYLLCHGKICCPLKAVKTILNAELSFEDSYYSQYRMQKCRLNTVTTIQDAELSFEDSYHSWYWMQNCHWKRVTAVGSGFRTVI